MAVHRPGAPGAGEAPDVAQQLALGDDPLRVAGQGDQKRELLGRERRRCARRRRRGGRGGRSRARPRAAPAPPPRRRGAAGPGDGRGARDSSGASARTSSAPRSRPRTAACGSARPGDEERGHPRVPGAVDRLANRGDEVEAAQPRAGRGRPPARRGGRRRGAPARARRSRRPAPRSGRGPGSRSGTPGSPGRRRPRGATMATARPRWPPGGWGSEPAARGRREYEVARGPDSPPSGEPGSARRAPGGRPASRPAGHSTTARAPRPPASRPRGSGSTTRRTAPDASRRAQPTAARRPTRVDARAGLEPEPLVRGEVGRAEQPHQPRQPPRGHVAAGHDERAVAGQERRRRAAEAVDAQSSHGVGHGARRRARRSRPDPRLDSIPGPRKARKAHGNPASELLQLSLRHGLHRGVRELPVPLQRGGLRLPRGGRGAGARVHRACRASATPSARTWSP